MPESIPPPALYNGNPPPRLWMYEIFFGPDGLRAGWGLLLYLALLAALLAGASQVASWLHPHAAAQAARAIGPQLINPRVALLNEGLPLSFVALATWIMSKIERRPNSNYGLALPRWLPHFFAGLLWGIAFLSLLVFVLCAVGLLVFDTRLLFGLHALRFALIWCAGFLLVGLFEEYAFRGYLQFTLARGLSGLFGWLHAPHREALGFWTAAFLLSFGFGFTHRSNPGESPIGLLAAGLIGLVFCLSLWRTGSLWWAIGFHAAWDWAESFLYGVSDSGAMVKGHLFATHPRGAAILSGGLTGPEGSLVILPLIALIALVIVRTLPRTGALLQPQVHRNPPAQHPATLAVD